MNIFDRLLPKINDWGLSKMEDDRHAMIAQAEGDVLELGFGTGLNLAHYGAIRSLTALEPSDPMRVRGVERAQTAGFPVRIEKGFAEKLPFPDASFDTVVATFVLCSVRDPEQVMREIQRVLRKGGKFITLEHVRADNPSLAKWQDRVAPVWKVVLGGCHPNRDLSGLAESAGKLTPVRVEKFRAGQQPFLITPHLRGVWVKST